VQLIDVPVSVSREQGDVHPDGNPHFLLDPENVLVAARAVADRLAQLDSAHASGYRERLERFIARWREHMVVWAEKLKPLAGRRAIVYHRLFDYLLRRYGIQQVATIEPLPGIPPASRHLAQLAELARGGGADLILQDVYHSPKAALYLAGQSGLRVVTLPHDVNACPGTGDLFVWFDEIVRRLEP
jgi:zinc/manganese transport system substrate-binding protein